MRPALPLSVQHTAAPAAIILLAIALFFIPQSTPLLEYNREDIIAGQWWRILTGNFLHTNFAHLVLNTAGIFLLWALHGEYYSAKRYLLTLTACALGTTISLLYLTPQMHQYVGLSGALHGVFVWGALNDIKRGMTSGWLLFAGVIAKVAYEQIAGPSEDVARLINAHVAIDAHLYGAVSGAIAFLMMLCWQQRRRLRS